MEVDRIEVPAASGPYPVLVGHGLLGRPGILDEWVGDGGVLAVTSRTVADLYLDRLSAPAGRDRCESLVLPDGEEGQGHQALAANPAPYDPPGAGPGLHADFAGWRLCG